MRILRNEVLGNEKESAEVIVIFMRSVEKKLKNQLLEAS